MTAAELQARLLIAERTLDDAHRALDAAWGRVASARREVNTLRLSLGLIQSLEAVHASTSA